MSPGGSGLPLDLDRALREVAESDLLLVAFDFDGTLSPIVADYKAAAPDRDAVETLFALAALPRTRVAVISGRAREDVERRLGDCPRDILLVGSHGAELSAEDEGLETGSGAAIERYVELLAPVAGRHPGVRLERKPHSLAFHYRGVEEPRQDMARRESLAAAGDAAVAVQEGKKVVEFFAVHADKGTALRNLRAGLDEPAGGSSSAVLFVGDDVTDEAGFEALDEADVGVKIGSGPTAARYAVDGQESVAPLLRRVYQLRASHAESAG